MNAVLVRHDRRRATEAATTALRRERSHDKVFPICAGRGSMHLTKHASEMLLGLESARHRHIHDARLPRAKQLLRAFHPAAQDELVRSLTGRFAKHHGEMRR